MRLFLGLQSSVCYVPPVSLGLHLPFPGSSWSTQSLGISKQERDTTFSRSQGVLPGDGSPGSKAWLAIKIWAWPPPDCLRHLPSEPLGCSLWLRTSCPAWSLGSPSPPAHTGVPRRLQGRSGDPCCTPRSSQTSGLCGPGAGHRGEQHKGWGERRQSS